MKAWENFAIIQNGTVQNICCFAPGGYTEASRIATAVFGDGASVVEVSYVPCKIGDTFRDGNFYDRESGAIIERWPTEEETLETHESAIDNLTIAILEG